MKKLSHIFSDFIYALPYLEKRAPILVLVYTGVAIEAALFKHSASSKPISQVRSTTPMLNEALLEILPQLPLQPKSAILLTVQAESALLELHVETSLDGHDQQLLQNVKWEIEPLLDKQLKLWSLGVILRASKVLNASDVELVLNEQKLRSDASELRFGDIAVGLNLASKAEVENAAVLQSQLTSPTDQAVCAWKINQSQAAKTGNGDSLIYAAAIGFTQQMRWVSLLESYHIRLDAIAPLWGATFALASNYHGLWLEVHEVRVVLARLIEGTPVVLLSRDAIDNNALEIATELLAEIKASPKEYLGGFCYQNEAEILSALYVRFDLTPAVIQDKEADGDSIGRLVHSAIMLANSKKSSVIPLLPGADKPPPVWQRTQTWIALAMLVLLMVISGYEAYAAWRVKTNLQQAEMMAALRAEKDAANNKIKSESEESKKLKAELITLSAAQQKAQQELTYLEQEINGRSTYISGLLNSMPEAVSESVMLRSVKEVSWYRVEVKAWSLSQASAYKLSKDISSQLSQWNFVAQDINVRSQKGPSGTEGFDVSFVLARPQLATTDAKNTAQPISQGNLE